MSKFAYIAIFLYVLVAAGFVSVAEAGGCTVFHEECTYTCIEYYPNKVDCRKTKKECVKVCDDFDVKKSGDTTEHQHITKQDSAVQSAGFSAYENVSSGSGGCCNATSEDGKKACSICCPKGKSANCSNTKTTASCSCGL